MNLHREDPSGMPSEPVVASEMEGLSSGSARESFFEGVGLEQAVVTGAGDAIVAYDVAGRVTVWNPAAERMLGWTAAEKIGRRSASSVDPDEISARAAELSAELGRTVAAGPEVFVVKVRPDEPETREWTYIAKDGRRIPVIQTVSMLASRDGKFRGYVSVARDITELKSAEAALSSAVAFREALISSAGELVVAYDVVGRVTVWNPAAERMLGWTAAEKIGGLLGNAADPDEISARAAELSAELGRTVAAGPEVFVVKVRPDEPETREWTYIAKDGRRIPVIQTVSSVTLGGRRIGFLCIARDISELKQTETALRSSEKKAIESADALQVANNELARSNAELVEFASVVSHDLQEPLRAISGCLGLLLETNRDSLDQKSAELVQFAVNGAERMRERIVDLLDYARVGRAAGVVGPVDCKRALDLALGSLRAAISESGATITSDALPDVFGTITEVTSLFQNVIGNAINYRSAEPPKIHVGCVFGEQGDMAEFRISDNGIGIDPRFHEDVFGIFRRLHSDGEISGTGIGLAICRKIVEHSHGRIWIESLVPSGTAFVFTLPLATVENEKSR